MLRMGCVVTLQPTLETEDCLAALALLLFKGAMFRGAAGTHAVSRGEPTTCHRALLVECMVHAAETIARASQTLGTVIDVAPSVPDVDPVHDARRETRYSQG